MKVIICGLLVLGAAVVFVIILAVVSQVFYGGKQGKCCLYDLTVV